MMKIRGYINTSMITSQADIVNDYATLILPIL